MASLKIENLKLHKSSIIMTPWSSQRIYDQDSIWNFQKQSMRINNHRQFHYLRLSCFVWEGVQFRNFKESPSYSPHWQNFSSHTFLIETFSNLISRKYSKYRVSYFLLMHYLVSFRKNVNIAEFSFVFPHVVDFFYPFLF